MEGRTASPLAVADAVSPPLSWELLGIGGHVGVAAWLVAAGMSRRSRRRAAAKAATAAGIHLGTSDSRAVLEEGIFWRRVLVAVLAPAVPLGTAFVLGLGR
jgi:hypothetical protein